MSEFNKRFKIILEHYDYADVWYKGKFYPADVPSLWKITRDRTPIIISPNDIWESDHDSTLDNARVESSDLSYPLLVDLYSEDKSKKYGIVDGSHRLMKHRMLGNTKIPVIVLTDTDMKYGIRMKSKVI